MDSMVVSFSAALMQPTVDLAVRKCLDGQNNTRNSCNSFAHKTACTVVVGMR